MAETVVNADSQLSPVKIGLSDDFKSALIWILIGTMIGAYIGSNHLGKDKRRINRNQSED